MRLPTYSSTSALLPYLFSRKEKVTSGMVSRPGPSEPLRATAPKPPRRSAWASKSEYTPSMTASTQPRVRILAPGCVDLTLSRRWSLAGPTGSVLACREPQELA